MSSLSELFSPFDFLELKCEIHGIHCLGLCSNSLCNSKTKLLCMKCIKSGTTCITKEKHELTTISELLLRFFKNENEKNKVIIKDIIKMNNIVNDSDKKVLNDIIDEFKVIKNEKVIKLIENKLYEIINYFVDTFKLKNNKKLEKLKERSKSHKKYDKEIYNILSIKMPEINKKSVSSEKKLKDIIKKGFKLSSPKNFVNSIKILNNKNKFSEITNRLNKKIHVSKVYSNISNFDNKRTILENKIDEILDDLGKKFEKKMENIEKTLLLPKNDSLIYTNIYNNSETKFISEPNNLIYKGDITTTAHKINSINKVFCAFKAFSNEKYIVWGTPFFNIEFFDLEKNIILKTIKNAHLNIIYSCRHYPDKKTKIDYLISSSFDRNVKIWNVNDFSNFLTIYSAHQSNTIYSVCILCEENENKNYVITSCTNDFMKIWDFSGKPVQKIGQMDENIYFVDTFYDVKNNKYYILSGNYSDVKSYEFKSGELYKRYRGVPQGWHMSAMVQEIKEQTILIESDGNGYVRMWEFHKANLIKSIFTNYMVNLRGICLWNDRYLFAGASDHQIKLFDIIEGKFIKCYKEHTSSVCTLEKIKSKRYGECLLSQGLDGKIKIWSAN